MDEKSKQSDKSQVSKPERSRATDPADTRDGAEQSKRSAMPVILASELDEKMPRVSWGVWRGESKLKRAGAWFLAKGYVFLPIIAVIFALAQTAPLLGPVINRAGDNLYHVMSEHALMHGVNAGDNVFGPAGIEFGQPILRFYQSLYYLTNLGMHFLTGLDLKFAHNLTIVLFFSFSPLTYLYFLLKLGLNRWAAAFGSLFSMTSVAAFGNSYEAYFQAGIVTQSMGGFFFPWFMGNFIGLLRGQNRATSTALLFALSFLAHAILSVFAVFAGAIYFLVTYTPIRRSWKKLTLFAVLGVCLVSFWALPFIQHTTEMRAVPDSIVRRGVMWFNSVSEDELPKLLFSGRLLDDAPVLHKNQSHPLDKLMDKINIMGTLHTRPPMLSIFVGVGALIALLGFRQVSRRFLLAGFAFALMLFAGQDDYRWLRFLPFMEHIQAFRCVYLVEFFAFGLAGIAVETVLRNVMKGVLYGPAWTRAILPPVWVGILVGVVGWSVYEYTALGRVHLDLRNMSSYDTQVDALAGVKNAGYPFRFCNRYEGRVKRRQAWAGVHGWNPYCTHWKAVGSTSQYYNCRDLGSPSLNRDYYALAGMRYYSASGDDKVGEFLAKMDPEGAPLFERLPNGPDRHGKNNHWHAIIDTGYEQFLRPVVMKPMPVVCSHEQWIWLLRSWAGRYRNRLWEETTPLPLRVRAGELRGELLLEKTEAILYFDHTNLEEDKDYLEDVRSGGGTIITPVEIPGIETKVVKAEDNFWDLLPPSLTSPKRREPDRYHREEDDPGFENMYVTRLGDGRRTRQLFGFDVDVLEDTPVVLPMSAMPGWTVKLDGKPWPHYNTALNVIGTIVPKGAHRLVFDWEMPNWHRWSLWAGLIALLVVILSWFTPPPRRRGAPLPVL